MAIHGRAAVFAKADGEFPAHYTSCSGTAGKRGRAGGADADNCSLLFLLRELRPPGRLKRSTSGVETI